MTSSKRRIWILTGEGIECEKEALRFFSDPSLESQVAYLPLHLLLETRDRFLASVKSGQDWLFLPGGFSFADHWGSGRLLAHTLKEHGIFEGAVKAGLNVMGICNGFQMLAHSGLFGDIELLSNHPEGFRDCWIRLRTTRGEHLQLPVRHGEGRLNFKTLKPGVEALLFYDDVGFSNGSRDHIAGLKTKVQNSWVVGMMPHPEIVIRAMDHNDRPLSEMPPAHQKNLQEHQGDGLRFIKHLFDKEFLAT